MGGFLAGPARGHHRAVESRSRSAIPASIGLICATPLGTPLDVQLEDLDRFATEVMPAFRGAQAGTRAAAE